MKTAYKVSMKPAKKLDDLQRLAKLSPEGDWVELGVYKGGSALLLSKLKGDRVLYLADSFEGLPEPGDNDTKPDGSKKKKGDITGTLEEVQELLKDETNIVYIKGWIVDDVRYFAQFPEEITLMHVDVDYEQPYRDTLKHLYPRMKKGSIIVFDDYGHFKGAKMAVDDFIAETGEELHITEGTSQAYVIVK